MTFTLVPLPGARSLASLAPATIVLVLAIGCAGGGSGDANPSPEVAIPVDPSLSGPCTRDLSSSGPDLTVFGADTRDFLADRFSLASGDFNGDGLDDILIGAPLADGPDDARPNGGEAYIIFGSAPVPPEIDLKSTDAGLTVFGESAGDNLGFTVASGDINGDGLDDAVVGARFASLQEKLAAGKAYVVYGRPDLAGTVDTAEGDPDVTIIGTDAGDFLSIALATGDVNGDGTADVLAGAVGDGPENDRIDAGEVSVLLGSSDLPAIIDLAERPPAFTVYAASKGDNLPNHLAAGDIDGDGSDELIIGAPFVDADGGREDAGRVYIVSAPGDGNSLDLAEGDGFSEVVGGLRRDALGFQVTSGDINGDGLDDIIVGARDADGFGDLTNNSGEVHILFGSTDGPRSLDLADQSADATVYGADAGDSLGFAVAIADVNGDGIDDLVTGAPLGDSCDNGRQDAGDAYVIFGRQGFPQEASTRDSAQLTFLGMEEGDELGFSLASGDFNGDGVDDLVLGALLADGPDNERPDAGEAHIIISRRR